MHPSGLHDRLLDRLGGFVVSIPRILMARHYWPSALSALLSLIYLTVSIWGFYTLKTTNFGYTDTGTAIAMLALISYIAGVIGLLFAAVAMGYLVLGLDADEPRLELDIGVVAALLAIIGTLGYIPSGLSALWIVVVALLILIVTPIIGSIYRRTTPFAGLK